MAQPRFGAGPDALVISPRGRLDLTSAPAFRDRLRTAVESGNIRLVVDLAAVDLIDSAGLSALIAGFRAARRAGGSLQVTNPSKQVGAILKLKDLLGMQEPVESRG